jgi:hypothetical protein
MFLRSHKSVGYLRISKHFMKPESSLPCAREPSNGTYPEPNESSLYHAILFLAFPPKSSLHSSSLLCMLHSLPIQGPVCHVLIGLFLWRRIVNPTPNHNAGGPPLVGCPLLLIQYICSYPPYLDAVSSIRNLRTRHGVVMGIYLTWTDGYY